jgi:hypothetical protein
METGPVCACRRVWQFFSHPFLQAPRRQVCHASLRAYGRLHGTLMPGCPLLAVHARRLPRLVQQARMYGCLQQTGRQGLPQTQATAGSRPARVRVVRARAAAQVEPKLEDIRGEAVRRGVRWPVGLHPAWPRSLRQTQQVQQYLTMQCAALQAGRTATLSSMHGSSRSRMCSLASCPGSSTRWTRFSIAHRTVAY